MSQEFLIMDAEIQKDDGFKSMTLDKNKRSEVFIARGIDPEKAKPYPGSREFYYPKLAALIKPNFTEKLPRGLPWGDSL
jgi:hypothetical protein